MKNKVPSFFRASGFFNLLAVSFLFYSCDTYNFSQPQPSDKANIYEFPKDYRGSWLSTDTSEKDAHLEYHIHKNNVLFISHSREAIVRGAWPKIDSKGEFVYPPGLMFSLESVNYDSLKKPIDTSENYLFKNKKIYELDNTGLSKGYDYKTEGDTIYLLRYDTTFIDLGLNAFLRKLNSNIYVFNIRNTVLGTENPWWRIMLMEKNNNQSFRIWVCSSKKGAFPSTFHKHHFDGSDIYYIDTSWSTADMLRMYNEGNFEIERELYKDTGPDR